MPDYKVLAVKNVSAGKQRAHHVTLLLDVDSKAGATAAIEQAVSDLMADNDALVLKAYLEEEAVQWDGYIARATAVRGKAVEIRFDNDPELRRAIYEMERGESETR